jgi:O-antigen biosynthesis alpha-1,2-mannosyltransferase
LRILVDIQGIQNRSKDRGIGRYVLSLARALAQHKGNHEVFFLINTLFGDDEKELLAKLGESVDRRQLVRFHGIGPAAEPEAEYRRNVRLSEVLLSDLVREIRPDVFLVGSFIEGWDDATTTIPASDYDNHLTAGILYDLIPLLDRQKYLGDGEAYRWYFRRLDHLARAQLLLAISESARGEGLRNLHRQPNSIVTIGTAASDEFASAAARARASDPNAELLSSFGITRPYIMHASAFDERKNFQGFVRSFGMLPKALRKRHQAVLVCKVSTADRTSISNLTRELGLEPDEIVMTGFVDDDELHALYRGAELFVFPSFHEGFGLPPLEAMSCGTPAIGSNTTSVPEVIGRADALFDPANHAEIAKLIRRALTDDAFRNSLIEHATIQAASFTWERSALAAINAIEQAVKARRQSRRAPPSAAPTLHEQLDFVRAMHQLPPPTERDLAIAVTRNRAEASRTNAKACNDTRLTWRIEGPFDSSYSLALVNRETARALHEFGHNVVLHSTEGPGDFDANPAFLAANPDLARMHDRVADYPPDQCDVVSRDLYPPRVGDMHSNSDALHNYGWEESGFPAKWVQDFNQHLQFITVLSEHVRKVLIDNGVKVPIAVSGAGVDHWLRIVPTPNFSVPGRGFRFLHVSSCFPRKGVDSLLDAYGRAFSIDDDVSLIIKTFENPHNQIFEMLAERRAANARYPHVVVMMDDLSDADLKALYAGCDVMVCPTRAEGYGLPLAEAMLSGIPAIATAWSGQMDFCNESNTWLVDYAFERADTHFKLWSSVWAKVDVGDLESAMRKARNSSVDERRAMAANGSAQLLDHHKWSDATARLIEAYRCQPPQASSPHLNVGWMTTWNAKCGIATYSEHLLRHFPRNVVVLANQEFDRLGGEQPNVVRCWRQSKEYGHLSDVVAEIGARSIHAVIIQFNYSFYNHDELASLIRALDDRGVAIILMLHSTNDPVIEIPGSELFRIKDALALADRLLVHSVADLNRLKAIGLVKNVALFPHGILIKENNARPRRAVAGQTVATYGFALPHKGLMEVLQAIALLRQRGRDVRLKMVNAEYPLEMSRELICQLKNEAARLGIEQAVEFHNEFLSDDQSLELLRSADLVVFAYQNTGESASGAVRYGLSSGRPVAVTPLAIFDDVGEAAFRFPATSIDAIADGLASFLDDLINDTSHATNVAKEAKSWREQHNYVWLGQRLALMVEALVQQRSQSAKQ